MDITIITCKCCTPPIIYDTPVLLSECGHIVCKHTVVYLNTYHICPLCSVENEHCFENDEIRYRVNQINVNYGEIKNIVNQINLYRYTYCTLHSKQFNQYCYCNAMFCEDCDGTMVNNNNDDDDDDEPHIHQLEPFDLDDNSLTNLVSNNRNTISYLLNSRKQSYLEEVKQQKRYKYEIKEHIEQELEKLRTSMINAINKEMALLGNTLTKKLDAIYDEEDTKKNKENIQIAETFMKHRNFNGINEKHGIYFKSSSILDSISFLEWSNGKAFLDIYCDEDDIGSCINEFITSNVSLMSPPMTNQPSIYKENQHPIYEPFDIPELIDFLTNKDPKTLVLQGDQGIGKKTRLFSLVSSMELYFNIVYLYLGGKDEGFIQRYFKSLSEKGFKILLILGEDQVKHYREQDFIDMDIKVIFLTYTNTIKIFDPSTLVLNCLPLHHDSLYQILYDGLKDKRCLINAPNQDIRVLIEQICQYKPRNIKDVAHFLDQDSTRTVYDYINKYLSQIPFYQLDSQSYKSLSSYICYDNHNQRETHLKILSSDISIELVLSIENHKILPKNIIFGDPSSTSLVDYTFTSDDSFFIQDNQIKLDIKKLSLVVDIQISIDSFVCLNKRIQWSPTPYPIPSYKDSTYRMMNLIPVIGTIIHNGNKIINSNSNNNNIFASIYSDYDRLKLISASRLPDIYSFLKKDSKGWKEYISICLLEFSGYMDDIKKVWKFLGEGIKDQFKEKYKRLDAWGIIEKDGIQTKIAISLGLNNNGKENFIPNHSDLISIDNKGLQHIGSATYLIVNNTINLKTERPYIKIESIFNRYNLKFQSNDNHVSTEPGIYFGTICGTIKLENGDEIEINGFCSQLKIVDKTTSFTIVPVLGAKGRNKLHFK